MLLVISNSLLLEKIFVLLVTPIFLSVTLTVALPVAFDNPLKVISFPLFVIDTCPEFNFSVVPSV